MYAIATVDGTLHTLQVWQEEGVEKLTTTNIELVGGDYTMTNFSLYNEDETLLAEDTNSYPFTVGVSQTIELPVDLDFNTGTTTPIRDVVVQGLDYGWGYLKSQGGQVPPTSETVTVDVIGLLGIPEDEIPYYVADPNKNNNYGDIVITSKIKCKFAINWYHNDVDMGYQHYNVGGTVPLELTYEKSNNPSDVDKFYFQILMYTVGVGQPAGSGIIANVNDGLDGDWNIVLAGDEDFVLNDNGLVEFSMYPEGWISEMEYQFTH